MIRVNIELKSLALSNNMKYYGMIMLVSELVIFSKRDDREFEAYVTTRFLAMDRCGGNE